jgi:hypothetical protein
MAFKFRLLLPDGEELPDFHCAVPNWLPGDELMITPRERYTIRAVISPDEFDGEYAAILEVEPL